MPASLPLAPSQATLPGRGTFSHLLRTVLSLPFGCPYGEVAPETLGVPPSLYLPFLSPPWKDKKLGVQQATDLCTKSAARHLEKEFPPP